MEEVHRAELHQHSHDHFGIDWDLQVKKGRQHDYLQCVDQTPEELKETGCKNTDYDIGCEKADQAFLCGFNHTFEQGDHLLVLDLLQLEL